LCADGLGRNVSADLKNNDVRFITYIPDNVFTRLIKGTGRGGPLDA